MTLEQYKKLLNIIHEVKTVDKFSTLGIYGNLLVYLK
jgi:hypothetical protein